MLIGPARGGNEGTVNPTAIINPNKGDYTHTFMSGACRTEKRTRAKQRSLSGHRRKDAGRWMVEEWDEKE